MNFTQFKNDIENGEVKGVYLFEGEDAYFREHGLQTIIDKFVTEPSINMAVFSGESLNIEEFTSSLFSYPFMSEKRLTVIRDYYPSAKDVPEKLTEFLLNPPSEDILVVVNQNTCDLFKKYQNVCYVDCSKADGNLLVRWIKGTLNREKIEIDLETAGTLKDYCLSDMTRIENEVNKLICYVGENGTVTKEILDQTVTRSTEYKIYEMTDYIAKKQIKMALSVINDMIYKGDKPQHVLSSVYNYFRRLLHASISGKSAEELASYFGIKEFAVTKIISQGKQFKKRSLKRAVDYLADADYKIKSGIADEFEEMWLVVFKILID